MLNVNVGVLGHVDSGKTSLVRALSTQLSTAALDKHPQSQQRGITLDLGFSSFLLKPSAQAKPSLQVTLVDCPGHASLFRTILGGVAIIDTVLLVVDCRKGLQAQTIESLLLATLIAKRSVVVALTKTDLLSSAERNDVIDKCSHEVRSFMATNFNFQDTSSIPVVPVAVGSGEDPQGIPQLLEALSANLQVPERDSSGGFCLAVDHCFSVPGNGTVLTGTVLSGALERGDELEMLPLGVKAKVKTLQVFKKDVAKCSQGDRVGVRVNGLDPALVERALAVAPPGSLTSVTQVVIPVTKVPFFRDVTCKSGGKCHVTVGHTTVIAMATFFTRLEGNKGENTEFDPLALYEYVGELYADEKRTDDGTVFALLQFEHAVFCPPKALVVCSRLDLDAKRFPCRLAFYGAVQSVVGSSDEELRALSAVHLSVVGLGDLQIGRVKSRDGLVDKVVMSNKENVREVIGREMFSKDVKWSVFQDSMVLFEKSRMLGTILGPFGKAGKFRLALMPGNSSLQLIPAPGEKFILRLFKLMTLKPPKLKGKAIGPGKSAKATAKTTGRSFVQDNRLLYPEAFEKIPALSNTVTKEIGSLTIDTVSGLAESRSGQIERLKGETTADGRNPFAVVSGLFDSEQEAEEAAGSRVRCGVTGDADEGVIEKPFGKAGKVRVDFRACGGTKGQVGDLVELS
ncbi:hypothetical protein V7S43_019000 [Phytophthora oleae]|uniref:Elongation factor Tu, chloroplastic n=1 Tax=Phytophthora oleae TaxID=2107226 RepID=A0ABD3ESF8_9STRA